MPDAGLIFAALADPTRRSMLDALAGGATTSVPELTAAYPMSRQAVAKHLATLDDAGLVERIEPERGREVRYRLADGWGSRLSRLKTIVEG